MQSPILGALAAFHNNGTDAQVLALPADNTKVAGPDDSIANLIVRGSSSIQGTRVDAFQTAAASNKDELPLMPIPRLMDAGQIWFKDMDEAVIPSKDEDVKGIFAGVWTSSIPGMHNEVENLLNTIISGQMKDFLFYKMADLKLQHAKNFIPILLKSVNQLSDFPDLVQAGSFTAAILDEAELPSKFSKNHAAHVDYKDNAAKLCKGFSDCPLDYALCP
ncbi:hypothetical protein L7F22_001386 [Adiantum nelumboides]|nr:hypothetical protein [Adiantum nelumboides]